MDAHPCRLLSRHPPGARLAALAGTALLAAACTSAPHELPPRSKLNRYELQSIEPEIRRHSDCLTRELGPAEAVSTAVSMQARSRCEPSLAQLRARLRAFNLSEDAQRRYLGALEIASRNRTSLRAAHAAQDGALE
ncbi:MAG: hypothetical protein M9951_06515 [Burkholderiaceae bacterium]|nr:hypothetical protein [Burkholderiaceae bacterium]MEB2317283.1 hypothetical protein [Pseudomonadota bacterium]